MSDYEAVKNATVRFWQNASDPKANIIVGFTATQNQVSACFKMPYIWRAELCVDLRRSRPLLQWSFTAGGIIR